MLFGVILVWGFAGKLAGGGELVYSADSDDGSMSVEFYTRASWAPSGFRATVYDLPATAKLVTSDGRADHSLFIGAMEGETRSRAIVRFAGFFIVEADWIALFGELPEAEARILVTPHFADPELKDAVVRTIAGFENHEEDDRGLLLGGLSSYQRATIQACAPALQKAGPVADKKTQTREITKIVGALAKLGSDKSRKAERQSLLKLFTKFSGASAADTDAALAWLRKHKPESAKGIAIAGRVDLAAELKRWDSIDWATGSVERGQKIIVERQCARCHEGSHRFGPDLKAVGRTWSAEELLAATIAPSYQISDAYRSTEITLRDGSVILGRSVYSSPAASLYRTGPGSDEVVRVTKDDVLTARPAEVSAMPGGLLAELTDQSLADLIAYLRSR